VADKKIPAIPWRWVDDDAQYSGHYGHRPDWHLQSADGECILWASHDDNSRDTEIHADPGVMEFIEAAVNAYHKLTEENERLKVRIAELEASND
jgi:hypothetical protein